MNKALKKISFILALVLCVSVFSLFPVLANDSEDDWTWKVSANGGKVEGKKIYYACSVAYDYFIDPVDPYRFEQTLKLPWGGYYSDGTSHVFSYSKNGEFIWVKTSEDDNYVYATATGSLMIEDFCEGDFGSYGMWNAEESFASVSKGLIELLDEASSPSSKTKIQVTTVDIKEATCYCIMAYDRTESLSITYGNVYRMPDGNLYYVDLYASKNPLFDKYGILIDTTELISVYRLEGEAAEKAESAIAVADDVYETEHDDGYEDKYPYDDEYAYEYDGMSLAFTVIFWITLIFVGIVVPTPLLVISLLLPRSKKLGHPKHWYVLTGISALWIFLSLILITMLIIL